MRFRNPQTPPTPCTSILLTNPRTKATLLHARMKNSGKIHTYEHRPLPDSSLELLKQRYFPSREPHRHPIIQDPDQQKDGHPLTFLPTPTAPGLPQTGRLATVPPEIIRSITPYLDATDLVSLSQTCVGFFHMIAYDQRLWYDRLRNANSGVHICDPITFKPDGKIHPYYRDGCWDYIAGHELLTAATATTTSDGGGDGGGSGEFDESCCYYSRVIEILEREDVDLKYETCYSCLTQRGVCDVFDNSTNVARFCQWCILDRFGGEYLTTFDMPINPRKYRSFRWENTLMAWIQHGYLKRGMIFKDWFSKRDFGTIAEKEFYRGYLLFSCWRSTPDVCSLDEIEWGVPMGPVPEWFCYR
ncbi:hypothetical protein TWF718_005050 [Orbilia javanica]|uniref:F-box domain-containing protein n=1 Tax=Orbilia javanica TaxID=47235 RepID=A0AAN8P0D2_9PEZI